MTINPLTVNAIMALVTGGIASLITQVIKKALKLEGVGAFILTAVICTACTAFYFLVLMPPFVIFTALLYDAVVFGEASGLYHIATLFQAKA
jgi:hypothetical protein